MPVSWGKVDGFRRYLRGKLSFLKMAIALIWMLREKGESKVMPTEVSDLNIWVKLPYRISIFKSLTNWSRLTKIHSYSPSLLLSLIYVYTVSL